MNLDLLTLLENIVSGFVSFFYSLAGSLFETVRHPFRGPIRLYRRYRDPKARQLGGLTFLCLSFFVAFYSLLEAPRITEPQHAAFELKRILSRLPKLGVVDLWPVLIASLTSTIVVDAALRLWLDFYIRTGRLRKRLVLGSIHYALFWPAPFSVFASLALSILLMLWGTGLVLEFFGTTSVLPYTIPAVVLFSIPAAAILSKGSRPAYRRNRNSPGKRIVAILAVSALLFGASYVGIKVGFAAKAHYVGAPDTSDECESNCV